jgi:hypothetical protein
MRYILEYNSIDNNLFNYIVSRIKIIESKFKNNIINGDEFRDIFFDQRNKSDKFNEFEIQYFKSIKKDIEYSFDTGLNQIRLSFIEYNEIRFYTLTIIKDKDDYFYICIIIDQGYHYHVDRYSEYYKLDQVNELKSFINILYDAENNILKDNI